MPYGWKRRRWRWGSRTSSTNWAGSRPTRCRSRCTPSCPRRCRCSESGGTWEPDHMSDPTAELFDRIADGYDEDVPFYATLGRLLVKWAEPAADARVLDIGAGRGAITRALVEFRGSAGQIVAGDISPKMVEQLSALQLPGVEARLL